MALVLLLMFMRNLGLIEGAEIAKEFGVQANNHTYLDVYSSAITRAHYNPWSCVYRAEPGYRCISCKSALHCYPGNFALLIQCAGLFPFCRNGYCSLYKSEGCNENENALSTDDGHQPTLPPYVYANHIKNKTENVADVNVTANLETTTTEVNKPVSEENAASVTSDDEHDSAEVTTKARVS